MKKIATLLLMLLGGLLLAIPRDCQAQAPAWQSLLPFVASNSANNAVAAGITATATDAAGNIYIGGFFNDDLTLGTTTLSTTVGVQCFVAKWSPASNTYLWAQAVNVYSLSALVVAGNSVYVAGTYLTDAIFGATTLTNSSPHNYTADTYVAKLTNVGGAPAWAWARQVSGSESETVGGLAVSGAAVYVAINFRGPTVSFGSLTLTNTLSYPGSEFNDVAVARLTDAGSSATYAWAVGAGGANDDLATALVASGNTLYVGGRFVNAATFPGFPAITSAGYIDGFVAQLADAGTTASYRWAQPLGTAEYDEVRSLALNGPVLYVAGIYYKDNLPIGATTLVNAGGIDGFVARCTPSATALNPAWAQRLGGANDDYPNALLARGSSVYVAGTFNNLFPGYPSQGNGTAGFGAAVLASAGGSDTFVARLTDAGTSGSYAWAQRAGGEGEDVAGTLTSVGTSLYVGGNLYGASATFGAYTLAKPGAPSLGGAGFLASLTELALPVRATTSLASLALFPNPARSTATVQVPTGPGLATLLLHDALGRVVRTATAPAGTDYPLSLVGLVPGVYALRVQVGEETATRRLVVE